MQIISSLTELTEGPAATAVTIGKFDCLHLGHQKLLTELAQAGLEQDLVTVAVTFDRHPNQVLRPEELKHPILGKNQKRQLLEQAGVQILLELEFNEELSNLTPEEFVKQYIVDGLRAKQVFVGEGFRFGRGGLGDCSELQTLGKKYGFSLKELKPIKKGTRVISTTWVRELLDQGDVKEVSELLGRVHKVHGVIEHGLKIGRKIGFPTANMARDAEGYLPVDGVYAGWLLTKNERYPAAHSVGINETFQAVPRLVESHILDRDDLDLYDQEVTLEFIDFVRPAQKFDGVDSLVAQIRLDLDKVREQLGL